MASEDLRSRAEASGDEQLLRLLDGVEAEREAAKEYDERAKTEGPYRREHHEWAAKMCRCEADDIEHAVELALLTEPAMCHLAGLLHLIDGMIEHDGMSARGHEEWPDYINARTLLLDYRCGQESSDEARAEHAGISHGARDF